MTKSELLEQLLQIEERLETAIDVSKVGFYDWDIKKNRIIFSDQMRRDWGFGPKEPLLAIDSRIHPEDRAKTLELIRNAVENREPYSTEYRVVRPDGTIVWIQAQGKVFDDSNGEAFRFFGTSLDVTHQKVLEGDLVKSRAAAERANAEKSLFLAGIAHEIRNPLAGIIGFSELLSDADFDERSRVDMALKIRRCGEGLLQILDNILDISKVEAGKLELKMSKTSIRQIALDVCDLFMDQARKKGITLEFLTEGDLPNYVSVDGTRLRQVLTNLVSNAVKFTISGGVKVHLRTVQGETGMHCEFRVKDSGIGLSPSQQKFLFQPFGQADETVHSKFGGTGLGLFVSKRIACLMNGDIVIEESAPNMGTTFLFSFTATLIDEAPEQMALQAHFETLFSNLRVLVADDSPETRYLTSCLLRKSGAVVTEATNGVDACAICSNTDFDFVLMDVEMPVMNGYEAAKSLRRSGFRKPIIALSGHSLPSERLKTFAAGCSGHLTKPLNPFQLRKLLQTSQ